jgi:hypothetical protein
VHFDRTGVAASPARTDPPKIPSTEVGNLGGDIFRNRHHFDFSSGVIGTEGSGAGSRSGGVDSTGGMQVVPYRARS